MLTPFRSALLSLCAIFSLQGCGAAPEMVQARPALWLVADDDTHVYLFGSVHALPDHMIWDGGPVQRAITKADTLVVELAPAEISKIGAVFARLASRNTPLAIEDRLTPSARAAYDALGIRERLALSDDLDDWAVSLALGQQASKASGLATENGVEAQIVAEFSAAKKKIIGLETAEMQLMMFETLPAETQRILLNNALIKSDEAVRDIHALLGAWSKGDVTAMEKLITRDMADAPIAHHRIITARNQRWAAWAAQQMEQPGTLLLAVGAGHMVGSEGLPALLAAKGLTVTRLQ